MGATFNAPLMAKLPIVPPPITGGPESPLRADYSKITDQDTLNSSAPLATLTPEQLSQSSYGDSASKIIGKARPSGDPQAAAGMASLLTEGQVYIKTLLGQ